MILITNSLRDYFALFSLLYQITIFWFFIVYLVQSECEGGRIAYYTWKFLIKSLLHISRIWRILNVVLMIGKILRYDIDCVMLPMKVLLI